MPPAAELAGEVPMELPGSPAPLGPVTGELRVLLAGLANGLRGPSVFNVGPPWVAQPAADKAMAQRSRKLFIPGIRLVESPWLFGKDRRRAASTPPGHPGHRGACYNLRASL